MKNYATPYIIRAAKNELYAIEVEEKIIKLCKNTKYKNIFDEMKLCNYNHFSILKDYLKKENIEISDMTMTSMNWEDSVSIYSCIKYLSGLKQELIELYKYLIFLSSPNINILEIKRIIKTEIYSIVLLNSINKTVKLSPYFTTPVIDLITSFKYCYLTLYYLNMSFENEESIITKRSLKDIAKGLEQKIEEIFNLIQSYTNSEIKIHKIVKNETLWTIAKIYDCPVDEIANLNSITNPYDIEKDKIILIPLKKDLIKINS